MAEKKSFRERGIDQRDEITAFWGTTRGLVIAGIVVVGTLGGIVWNTIAGLFQ